MMMSMFSYPRSRSLAQTASATQATHRNRPQHRARRLSRPPAMRRPPRRLGPRLPPLTVAAAAICWQRQVPRPIWPANRAPQRCRQLRPRQPARRPRPCGDAPAGSRPPAKSPSQFAAPTGSLSRPSALMPRLPDQPPSAVASRRTSPRARTATAGREPTERRSPARTGPTAARQLASPAAPVPRARPHIDESTGAAPQERSATYQPLALKLRAGRLAMNGAGRLTRAPHRLRCGPADSRRRRARAGFPPRAHGRVPPS